MSSRACPEKGRLLPPKMRTGSIEAAAITTSSAAGGRGGTGLSGSLSATDLFGQLRDDGEQVSHHEQVRELTDGRIRILVDGDHILRRLHTYPVLDRTRYASRQVERGFHDLSRLPNLQLIGHPAGIRRGPAGSHGATQDIRELLELRESVGAAHAAPASDDELRLLEVDRR